MTSSPFLAALSLVLLSALVSCGGSSRRDGDRDGDDGGGGGSSAGNAGRGGTNASGAGGNGTGGSASGSGGSTAGSGNPAGGAAGEPSAICSLPAVAGDCDGAIPRFFHNSDTGFCETFVYGGCGGNENNFETLEECEAECGSQPLDACNANSECVVTPIGCCGTCEPSTLESWIALNAASVSAYRESQMCDLVGCPAVYCPPPPPTEATSTYFTAICEAGRCKALDLRTTPVTACDEPSDCSLRHGVRCCEACGDTPDDVVAVSDEAALLELVCPSEPAACPPCVPVEPEGFASDCVEGRCVVTEDEVN
jgi:hypothetical protein